MSLRYVLETHALIFAVLQPGRLGSKARRVIENAGAGELAVASVSLAEIGQLIHDGKLEFEGRPSEVFGPLLGRCVVVPLSIDAAVAAPALRLPHGDPADRQIVAMAADLGVPLVTKDANITDAGLVRVVW